MSENEQTQAQEPIDPEKGGRGMPADQFAKIPMAVRMACIRGGMRYKEAQELYDNDQLPREFHLAAEAHDKAIADLTADVEEGLEKTGTSTPDTGSADSAPTPPSEDTAASAASDREGA